MKKFFCCLFSILFLFLTRVSTVYPYYIEEFDNEPTNWFINQNDGEILFHDGIVELIGGYFYIFPYLYPEINIFPPLDYSIETRFRFSGNYNYGAGIAFTDILLNNDRPQEQTWDDVIFLAWPVAETNTFNFYSVPCLETDSVCDNDGSLVFEGNFNEWQNLKITRENSVYYFFLNQTLINQTLPTEKLLSHLWVGNPQRTNHVFFPNIEIDYIHVEDLSSPPEKTPIIILPGLGASWDFSALLNGGEGDDWRIPGFVSTYQNLEDSLVNAGYEKDVDYFIFTYDWRKGLADLDDDLNSYINSLISDSLIDSDERIDLIGHSMGGLVARSFSQNMGTEKINRLITLGSPHEGATDSYFTWEGATVIDRPWWQKIAVELLIELNRLPGESRVSALRRMAPGIKDLLPTYDFLVLEERLIPWTEMSQRNENLDSLTDISGIDSLTTVLAGKDIETGETILIEKRNWKDKLLDKWEDGKPVSGGGFSYQSGDGTVLLTSAKGDFSDSVEISSDHRGLVSETAGLDSLFDQLGLDSDAVTETEVDSRKEVLAVVLKSPGKLNVCQETICNENLGLYFETKKLFLLPGYTNEETEIVVEENGLGDYDLHIGKINSDTSEWKRISGSLEEEDQEDRYMIGGDFVLQIPLANLRRDLIVNEGNLSLLIDWDDEGLMERLLENESLREKLRTARRIRWKLYRLMKENSEDEILSQRVISFWKSLDNLIEALSFNEDFHHLSQCNYWREVMERHQFEAETEMDEADNYYAAIFWQAGEERRDELREIDLEETLVPYSLVMDKVNSAEYLFLTAKAIK